MATLNGTPMVLVEIQTRHFQFQALAETQEDGQQQLRDAWEIHCRDYPDADMDFMRWCIEQDEVTYTDINVGGVVRDGETIL